jgi:hypothetical protein
MDGRREHGLSASPPELDQHHLLVVAGEREILILIRPRRILDGVEPVRHRLPRPAETGRCRRQQEAGSGDCFCRVKVDVEQPAGRVTEGNADVPGQVRREEFREVNRVGGECLPRIDNRPPRSVGNGDWDPLPLREVVRGRLAGGPGHSVRV